jgi:CheY-like chemotaxis protein
MNSQTILLIDDDSDFLAALTARCRNLGLEVNQARNLLTALTAIKRRPPDVICLDVAMPTGNGLQLCRMLREDPRTSNIPIVIVTGNPSLEVRNECQHMGAYFVPKTEQFWRLLEPFLKTILTERRPINYASASHERLTPRGMHGAGTE